MFTDPWGVWHGAFLAVVRVLEHEGPFLPRRDTGCRWPSLFPSRGSFPPGPVRVVAVYAEDLFLGHRMVVRRGEGRLHVLMALVAELGRVRGPYLQIVARVNVVAVRAGDFGDAVGARIPVVEVERGVGRVALEADEGLCLGRQVLDVHEGLVIAGRLLSGGLDRPYLLRRQVLDGETAGSRGSFRSSRAAVPIPSKAARPWWKGRSPPILVVNMACLKTVVRSDVIRVGPARDHLFVLPDRQDRPRLLERRAASAIPAARAPPSPIPSVSRFFPPASPHYYGSLEYFSFRFSNPQSTFRNSNFPAPFPGREDIQLLLAAYDALEELRTGPLFYGLRRRAYGVRRNSANAHDTVDEESCFLVADCYDNDPAPFILHAGGKAEPPAEVDHREHLAPAPSRRRHRRKRSVPRLYTRA